MIDYSLYLVTDRSLSRNRSTVEVVTAAIQGGVSCVQLREKECSTREFIAEARAVQQILRLKNIPLIINDRVDVALVIGANGVHLGRNDMPLKDARRLVGSSMVIGISAESLDDAVKAEAGGADYVGISPVFSTTTKQDTAAPLGINGILEIRKAIKLPLIAIGGIDYDNAIGVLDAGADGLAVVSAIVSATCPEKATRKLYQAIRKTSKKRG